MLEHYQKMPLEEILKTLNANEKGLTNEEAKRRLKQYGPNELIKKKRQNTILKFLSYFKNPLIIILLIAAAVSGVMGEIQNFVIIISMVLLGVTLNFYQEHKSNKAAEKIAKRLAVRAGVLRDDVKKELFTHCLVPGDVVLLSAGDIIPADGCLIEADDFFVNEAALTGESFPVEKIIQDMEPNQGVVFSGTNVVSGFARYVVVRTGARTEYGMLARELNAPDEINAFEIGINNFGMLIIKMIVGVVLVILLINALRHKDLLDSLIFALAVAVGLTPELLPMIMSVNMAKGSIKMAKNGVIVKRQSAIPDFGSMDVLCTDKTGTLTEDKITLVKHLDVHGNPSEDPLRYAYINGAFETGIRSVLDHAILAYKHLSIGDLKKIDEIPYDFLRKRSSIIYEEDGARKMTTKGAPEELFKICTSYEIEGKHAELTESKRKECNALYEKLSADGFRVLAVATKNIKKIQSSYAARDEHEMTLTGFVAFYDPPKESARETLIFMKQHGVDIKILTGDSPLVTRKICEDLGMEIKGVVLGDEMDINTMSDAAIAHKAEHANIFARLSPNQKERLIMALRAQGLVVGYLGDGINDALSLKAADVGISVSNAVDVAKETADIILMKKSLRELMEGVLEGRKTFGNTMKYLMMGLSSNFGNMLSMIGAALYLPFFPMLPGQILLNNFLYDFSQLSIPLDCVDKTYLKKPKHWDIKFVRNFMYVFGPVSSLFDLITFYLLYSVFHLQSSTFQAGWFIESLATQILVIYVIRTRRIPFIQSSPSAPVVIATLGILGIGTVLAVSPISSFFGFSPLPLPILFTIMGLVVVYLLMVEVVKHIFYYFHKEERI
ncbi:MAG: Magnesium-translocating P-type ATPase [Candidatus Magasanikbacteria bacterium GW2011_GWC2_45_8]|uniref:Magnesium-transporting ATPase, P-type 1 n=2 Tax=Candidatus Magasanikiibacteriota TaxID=1752731 RepID=A0A0G1MYR5_9BACT|nr:MAG: Magnesium-translocating P-type ATPase [Candidatus Magasanikbacteria bacterium GW2011_GWC2_45_8]